MAKRRDRFARSGDPGSFRFCVVYLRPSSRATLLTDNSASVSRCRIRPMRRDIVAVVVSGRSPVNALSTRLNARRPTSRGARDVALFDLDLMIRGGRPHALQVYANSIYEARLESELRSTRTLQETCGGLF